jgi:hypothetical protein
MTVLSESEMAVVKLFLSLVFMAIIAMLMQDDEG